MPHFPVQPIQPLRPEAQLLTLALDLPAMGSRMLRLTPEAPHADAARASARKAAAAKRKAASVSKEESLCETIPSAENAADILRFSARMALPSRGRNRYTVIS
ncbi:hypothetical protein [Faecalibacterium hattorii]|uniref:hypothetical protein n=1 Tax=Faecalibacterium hattorii TaxID=2935520 RepID=UPI003AAC27D3